MAREGTILLTGFPGRRYEIDNFKNPTGIIAKELDGERLCGYRIDSHVIDCDILDRPKVYRELFKDKTKRRVAALALGMYDTGCFELESRAINVVDTFGLPSIDPPEITWGQPLDLDRPFMESVHNTSVPLDKMEQHMTDAGFKTIVSDDPGTLGCNAAAYGLYTLQDEYPRVPILFAHVPYNFDCARQVLDDNGVPAHISPLSRCDSVYTQANAVNYMPIEKIQEGVEAMLLFLARSALNRALR